MATKKTASTAKKKSTTKRKSAPVAKKTTTTKVTTSSVSSAASVSRRFKFSQAPLLAASVAEFVGTFLLAAIVIAVSGQPLFVLFGLATIVLAIGAMSGAHVNPALTVAAWATKRIDAARAVSYVIAQVLGAILALVVLNAFLNGAPEPSAQAAQLGQAAPELFKAAAIPEGKEWFVLGAELVGMAIFGFAVASAMRMKETLSAAFTVGGGLYLGLIVAGTATSYVSASSILNPAIAGALQAVHWSLWPIMIYVVTPLVGAVLGFALNDLVAKESKA